MKKYVSWGQSILLTFYIVIFTIMAWILTKWNNFRIWIVRNYYLVFHNNRCIELHFVVGTGQDFLETGKIKTGHVYQTISGSKIRALGNNVFLYQK